MSWYIKKILIDSNEKIRGYNALNYYNKNYEVSVERLDYGDYLFQTTDDKHSVFEFKTCKDFISSMENKSLFQELSNQTINNKYSYLVICGDFLETFDELYFEVPHYRYKYKAKHMLINRLSKQVQGALSRIYAMYIPVIFAENEEDAFDKMLKVSSKIADSKKYGGVVRPSVKSLKMSPVEYYLTGIDGIGEKRAKLIRQEYDVMCLDDLCQLSPEQFLSIKGLKKKNVVELWKQIHNETININEQFGGL